MQKTCDILITGSGGKVARMVRSALDKTQNAADILYQSRTPGADIQWHPGQTYADLPKCKTIVALWGVTHGTPEELRKNTELAVEAHYMARALGARRVIHLSSIAVYGPGVDLSELSPLNPVTDYGQAKVQMEQRIADLSGQGVEHLILRVSNVVGAESLGAALRSPAPLMLDQFEDGNSPLRSYITATDLSKVLVKLASLPPDLPHNVLNVSAPEPIYMEHLARAAGKQIIWKQAKSGALQVVTIVTDSLSAMLPGHRFLATADQMITDWRFVTKADGSVISETGVA